MRRELLLSFRVRATSQQTFTQGQTISQKLLRISVLQKLDAKEDMEEDYKEHDIDYVVD